jgi:hypothetical protein
MADTELTLKLEVMASYVNHFIPSLVALRCSLLKALVTCYDMPNLLEV